MPVILHDYRYMSVVLYRTMHLFCLTFRMFYSYMNAFSQNCLFSIPISQVCHINYHVILFWHNHTNTQHKYVSVKTSQHFKLYNCMLASYHVMYVCGENITDTQHLKAGQNLVVDNNRCSSSLCILVNHRQHLFALSILCILHLHRWWRCVHRVVVMFIIYFV